MRATLLAGDVTEIEYATVADPRTLQPIEEATSDSMALIAAGVGSTRLIDNCRLGED